MANKYEWRFRVRSYEVGANGEVSPAVYLNYLEETAIQASESLGYYYDWYFQQQRMWLVRKLTLREFAPARVNDELVLTTWIGDVRRVQVNREYTLRRASDDASLLRVRHNWVFVNMQTLLPERFPPEFAGKFDPTGEVESLDIDLIDPIPVVAPITHSEERRVQYLELDQNGHVNNAVYINWVEQSMTAALRAVGWPPQRIRSGTVTMRRIAREMEYFRSALDDEPIQVITRLAETGQDRAAWSNEIRHATSNELIARDRTVWTFSDEHGACPMPADLRQALGG